MWVSGFHSEALGGPLSVGLEFDNILSTRHWIKSPFWTHLVQLAAICNHLLAEDVSQSADFYSLFWSWSVIDLTPDIDAIV